MPQMQGHIFVKEILLKHKSHMKPHTLAVGDFNTPLLPMDRFPRHKLNSEIMALTDVTNQMDPTDIYRTSHQNTHKKYTFFSTPHKTISNIDHILGHKASLNR